MSYFKLFLPVQGNIKVYKKTRKSGQRKWRGTKKRKYSERFLSLAHNLAPFLFQLLGLLLGLLGAGSLFFPISPCRPLKCLRNPEAANLLPIPCFKCLRNTKIFAGKRRLQKRDRARERRSASQRDSYRGKQF